MSSKNYVKKDQISHVLLRPQMYIGSADLRNSTEYVAFKNDEDNYQIRSKDIKTSPAFLRIFIEILSNAIDNYQRSVEAKIPCSYIKVYIDKITGETSIINDGDYIPIEINKDEKMYNHTLIFGHLLSGSNFDDDKERQVSGLNGVGSSACNIFSTKFIVESLDPEKGLTFTQTWTNNMRTVSEPIIQKTKLKKAFTKITYFPDFERFGLTGYNDDLLSQYMKYILDTAILTKVKVYFNDELIPVNNLVSYSKLFDTPSDESIMFKYKTSEVVLTPSNEFEAITFVNGIFTKLGGTHLDAWSEAIFRPILNKLNGKKDKAVLTIKDVKQMFRIFIVTTVNNPSFESQSKNKLESPKVEAEVKTADVNKIWKWSVISDLQDIIKSKEMIVLKKSEKKKKGYVKIDGLDPANLSGTKHSHLCSLILCEGLSAKTYAVAGLDKGVYDKTGRDYFGVLSLTGKVLNCRNSNLPTISKNKVITNLIQALGLQFGVDYTDDENYKTLSYGKIILLTDADVDGLHISGLILNFLHFLFPSLLKRPEPFLISMQTPIVRVFNKGGDILFYDENRFKEFAKNQTKSFKSKYYKGLGTTKTEDVPDTFGEKMVEYINDTETDKTIDKVFHKNFADDRKKWIEHYNPVSEFSLDDGGKLIKMKMSSFLNNEVIKFSHDDCKRSIPNLFDGLKCLHPDTKILLYDGNIKLAKNITVGDKLIGDNGLSCNVVNTCKGNDLMYMIEQVKGENYIVNSKHILTLRFSGHKSIFWSKTTESWQVKWVENNVIKSKNFGIRPTGIHKNSKKYILKTKEEVYKDIKEFCSKLPDNDIIDISIEEYLKLNKTLKKHLCGIKSNCIYWDKKEVQLDPYILGSWLGDGTSDGKNICGEDPDILNYWREWCEMNDCELIHKNKFTFYIRRAGNTTRFVLPVGYTNINDCEGCKHEKSIICGNVLELKELLKNDKNNELIKKQILLREKIDLNKYKINMSDGNKSKYGIPLNPLVEYLKKYNLIQNKRIPIDYLINDKEVRLKLLAGILDTDGYIRDNGHSFEISQSEIRENLIDDILFLCRSLGFSCSKRIKNVKYQYNGKQMIKKQFIARVSGLNLTEIPVLLKRKKCFNPIKRNVLNTMIKIYPVGFGDFNGFTIDNENNRFLLGDFTITHNCSQRKIIFGIKKRNLTYNKQSVKVAQLGGYIAEHSNYHHGEQNLYQTIVKMAHEFPGSNNIPLLYRDGQFGSKSYNGDDSASPRYIYTKMEPLTPLLFREEDDVLLDYVEDDGDVLEPTFYIPILPTILINGCTAIGTGWSSNIPCFNPLDIIECVKIWLENDGEVLIDDPDDNSTLSLLPSLTPWYRGFKGVIEEKDNRFITYGILTKETVRTNVKVNITELPIGLSTDKFKDFCEDLLVEKCIKALHNESSPQNVNFTITESEDGMSCNLTNMKMFSYLNLTNMVLFNEKNQLKKYSVDEIINDFCVMRFEYYKKRKQHLINQLQKELKHLGNKARFIQEVTEKKLNIMNIEEEVLSKELEKRKYDKEFNKKDVDEDEERQGGYEYLLRMPVKVLTSNQIKKLRNDILSLEKKLDGIQKTSEKNMWLNDINEFEIEYHKWLKVMETISSNSKKLKKKK